MTFEIPKAANDNDRDYENTLKKRELLQRKEQLERSGKLINKVSQWMELKRLDIQHFAALDKTHNPRSQTLAEARSILSGLDEAYDTTWRLVGHAEMHPLDEVAFHEANVASAMLENKFIEADQNFPKLVHDE